MELDLTSLLDMRVSSLKAVVPPKFPTVSRDLAFLINKDVNYEAVKKEIKMCDKLITDVRIFDLYEGANIDSSKKSMALTIDFSSPDRTLKDEEVNVVMEKVIGALKIRFLAEVRQ
jgi:phenylalanyl-tRNA synthetase beta chain